MDAVKLFNTELSSLYETRPPISKAKMTTITRTAIKAIKFYKHVVQSVEKFIQKCKPEYKVPGLYVIDSIVRQSRHQFTAEKDVFAPRFARNIQNTFLHLFNCPHDDKGKIVRVLNLWQKNQVFTPEVIGPLLDMASLASKEQLVPSNGVQLKTPPNSSRGDTKPSPAKDQPSWMNMSHQSLDLNNTGTPQPVNPPSKLVKFDKKLLDYDYGEEEDDETSSPKPSVQSQPPLPSLDSLTSILSNPEVLRQLQTLQQQMSVRQQQADNDEKMRRLQEMRHQEEEFDKHLAQTVPNLPFAAECDFKPTSGGVSGGGEVGGVSLQQMLQPVGVPPPSQGPTLPHHDYATAAAQFRAAAAAALLNEDQDHSRPVVDYDERTRQLGQRTDNGGVVEVIDLIRMESPSRDSPPRRRRRSRSRSRGRNRSRSRSRRRRSRSNERDRDFDRDWDGRKVRESEREKERERRRRGLPPIKKNHLAVCSTTLWIGHLSKLVQQEELSDTFGEYGDIVSINLIPPRGCAFVCMNRRQDAAKALQQLKHYKLQSKAITIAWAPGKGMKDREWKDYWEVDQGVSYIPWSKLTPDTDFELLEEGGMLDEETFPDWLKETLSAKRDKERQDSTGMMVEESMEESSNTGGVMHPPELDIPMPSATTMPGFIPLQEVPNSVSQAGMGPPPMGLIPPFALPPNNVGLMGPMGMPAGLMGNVPLGVPPPLMMPQQMVPRMPASPFNPSLLLGGGGGGAQQDKGKASLPQLGVPPPSTADTFPDHLAPMVNPFGLPMPLTGINASGLLGQNKGPVEMDVDDLNDNEKESLRNTAQGLSLMNSMVGGGFHQGAAFGAMPLVQLAQHPLGLLAQQQQQAMGQQEFGQQQMQQAKNGMLEDESKKREESGSRSENNNDGNEDNGKDGDTDMRGRDDERKKGRRGGDSPPGRSGDKRGSGGRRRDWGKPRVNRWGDSTQENNDRNERRGRSPGLENSRQLNKDGMERQPLLGLPLPAEHHYQQPNRPPMGVGLLGPFGGAGAFGPMDRDERGNLVGDEREDYPPPLLNSPRGFFPRGPVVPRGPSPRPLLRTPNGPMFGPRGHPPGPPGMMGMRGLRPGGRMEGMGYPMRGFPPGGRGRGGRFPPPPPPPPPPQSGRGDRRWGEEGRSSRWQGGQEEERKSRWSSAKEDEVGESVKGAEAEAPIGETEPLPPSPTTTFISEEKKEDAAPPPVESAPSPPPPRDPTPPPPSAPSPPPPRAPTPPPVSEPAPAPTPPPSSPPKEDPVPSEQPSTQEEH